MSEEYIALRALWKGNFGSRLYSRETSVTMVKLHSYEVGDVQLSDTVVTGCKKKLSLRNYYFLITFHSGYIQCSFSR